MNIAKMLYRSTLIVLRMSALAACGDTTPKPAEGESAHGHSHE